MFVQKTDEWKWTVECRHFSIIPNQFPNSFFFFKFIAHSVWTRGQIYIEQKKGSDGQKRHARNRIVGKGPFEVQ
jgi:hypothetical protein